MNTGHRSSARLAWFLALLMGCCLALPSTVAAADTPANSPEDPAPPAAAAQSGAASAADAADAADPLIFSDDFEAYGDSSLWGSRKMFPVQSDVVADGYYAARISNYGDSPVYGRKRLDRNYDKLYVRVRFNVLTLGGGTPALVNLRSGDASSTLAVRIDTSGTISYLTGATGITATAAVTATPGEWHELQVYVDTTSETDNIRIWLDQAELTTLRHSAYLGDRTIRIVDMGDNSAGQHSDIAYDDFAVDEAFIPSSRPADPVSGTLVATTYPTAEGIPFELDGETFYSNAHGVVTIHVKRWSTDLRSRIKVGESTQADGSVTTFTGWRNWRNAKSRQVAAAFSVSQPVSFSFVDLAGNPVDPSMIDQLTIKSDSGVIKTLTGPELAKPALITVSSVSPSPTGITTQASQYVVDEVLINGENVVNRSQQKSALETSRNWTITLLFYGVTFQSKDAFFGSPIGHEILLTAADGTEQRLPLDADGKAVISRLPRGSYSVAVVGSGGYAPARPILVSRDQVVELEVISQLDMAVALGVVGSVVLGLLIAGRPFLVTAPVRWTWGAVTALQWPGWRRAQ